MSLVLGKDVALLEWNEALSSWVPFACARSCSLSVDSDFMEVSGTYSGKFRDYSFVANSFTGTLEGILDLQKENHYTLADIRAKQLNGTLLLMRFDRTDMDANVYADEGYFYVSNTTDVDSFDNIVTFNVSIRGTGELTQIFTPAIIAGSTTEFMYYPSDGSFETTIQDSLLIGVTVIGAWRQTDYQVITTGTVLVNEVKHDPVAGTMTWVIPMEADEVWHFQFR